MSTALVTGATAGIGHEFADQLAGRGLDLVIVARDVERLERVATAFREAHRVQVEVLPADLADREQLQRVADRVADPGRPIDVLVNNAGYALRGQFLDNDAAAEEQLFDVLVRAVLVLSHAGARGMRERRRGTIINVSSVAGFAAAGTYSAAKSYVTVFSEGLAAELAGTGVRVTALCPGFTMTEFHQRAGISSPGPAFLWLDAGRVVRDCLADLARGRVVSVPSVQYQAIVGLLRLAPRSLVRRQIRSTRLATRARAN